MVNKRGWLRIVEASIAVMMVLSSLLIIGNGIKVDRETNPQNRFYYLLEEMSKNNTLRGVILSYNYSNPESETNNLQIITSINGFLANEIKDNTMNYKFNICAPLDSCTIGANVSKEVYSSERIITANLTSQGLNEKKIKIYWGFK